MKRFPNLVAWILLAAAAAGALAFSARTLVATPGLMRQLQRRASDLERLRTLAADTASDRALLQALADTGGSPPSLGELVNAALPSAAAEFQVRETRALIEGWSLRRVDVILGDVSLADVGSLLARAEEARPPWRVAEFQVTASDGPGGRGRVTLVMEGLERTSRTASP